MTEENEATKEGEEAQTTEETQQAPIGLTPESQEQLAAAPAFPIMLAANGVPVVLNADGTYNGDAEKIEAAMHVLPHQPGPGAIIMWLVLAHMKLAEAQLPTDVGVEVTE